MKIIATLETMFALAYVMPGANGIRIVCWQTSSQWNNWNRSRMKWHANYNSLDNLVNEQNR